MKQMRTILLLTFLIFISTLDLSSAADESNCKYVWSYVFIEATENNAMINSSKLFFSIDYSRSETLQDLSIDKNELINKLEDNIIRLNSDGIVYSLDDISYNFAIDPSSRCDENYYKEKNSKLYEFANAISVDSLELNIESIKLVENFINAYDR